MQTISTHVKHSDIHMLTGFGIHPLRKNISLSVLRTLIVVKLLFLPSVYISNKATAKDLFTGIKISNTAVFSQLMAPLARSTLEQFPYRKCCSPASFT